MGNLDFLQNLFSQCQQDYEQQQPDYPIVVLVSSVLVSNQSNLLPTVSQLDLQYYPARTIPRPGGGPGTALPATLSGPGQIAFSSGGTTPGSVSLSVSCFPIGTPALYPAPVIQLYYYAADRVTVISSIAEELSTAAGVQGQLAFGGPSPFGGDMAAQYLLSFSSPFVGPG